MRHTPAQAEDKRLVEYRNQVWLRNSVGSLRVFCGGVGLLGLFVLAGTELIKACDVLRGTLAGGTAILFVHLGRSLFSACSFWGFFRPWSDYSSENARECSGREEMLAQIVKDPDWWRKRDERKQQWKKEREEIEAKLAAMGIHPDPEYWTKALERSRESLAELTRKLEGTKPQGTKP